MKKDIADEIPEKKRTNIGVNNVTTPSITAIMPPIIRFIAKNMINIKRNDNTFFSAYFIATSNSSVMQLPIINTTTTLIYCAY